MNRIHKLAISVLLLMLCAALSGASAQSIAIKAEGGGSLPDSICVGEIFMVLITDDDSPVGAGTSVAFMLPHDSGDPTYVWTDDNGKARYPPQITGTLGIRVRDGLVTVAEATVDVTDTTTTKQLDRVVILDSADPEIGNTEPFYATCYATDATGGDTITGCTLTWTCDRCVVGTIDSSSGLFTAAGVGTTTVTVTATYGGRTRTDTAIVNVSGSTETVPVNGENFTETSINAGTAANINVSGEFNNSVIGGSIVITPIADPEANVSTYRFTGNDLALIGLVMEPDTAVRNELADGNDTIRIEMCYNETELASKNIKSSTLAIWRFDGTDWVRMVEGTDPCVANGRDGNCVWINLTNLSTYALVGTKTTSNDNGGGGGGGSSGGTYPPATPTPTVTATAAPTAQPGATSKVTPVTTPVKVVKTPAEVKTPAPTPKSPRTRIPGFTSVSLISGLLAALYLVLRRRE